jgi:hypothetical protein
LFVSLFSFLLSICTSQSFVTLWILFFFLIPLSFFILPSEINIVMPLFKASITSHNPLWILFFFFPLPLTHLSSIYLLFSSFRLLYYCLLDYFLLMIVGVWVLFYAVGPIFLSAGSMVVLSTSVLEGLVVETLKRRKESTMAFWFGA